MPGACDMLLELLSWLGLRYGAAGQSQSRRQMRCLTVEKGSDVCNPTKLKISEVRSNCFVFYITVIQLSL